jgi:hypothetical protein
VPAYQGGRGWWLAFAASIAVAVGIAAAQTGVPSSRTNTVFVTAVSDAGVPVADLVASDFLIKEDGKAREVLRAELTSAPVQLAILVDDNGTGLFRAGLINFVRLMQGRARIELSSVVGQTQRLVDYTADMDRLTSVIATLTARPGTNDGGQLLEGIYEAARHQEKLEALRPVIVALTVGGEEHSTVPAHVVLNQLAKAGSKLYVIQVAGTMLRPTVPITQSRQLLGENLNLSEVLGTGPKQTGGIREEIVATPGLLSGLQRIATELQNQYALEYARPPKGKPLESLDVSVRRRGLNLRAPTKVAGR